MKRQNKAYYKNTTSPKYLSHSLVVDLNKKELSQQELNDLLIDSCISGNLPQVELLLTSSHPNLKAQIDYLDHEPLMQSIKHSQLDVIEYLLTSPALAHRANINARIAKSFIPLDSALMVACRYASVEVLRFLLSRPNLLQNNPVCINNAFLYACEFNRVDIIQLLLCDKSLRFNSSVHYKNDQALIKASANGHLSVVRFLLTSDKLKEHCMVDAQDNAALCVACENGHLNIVNYLLTSVELYEHSNIYSRASEAFLLACSHFRQEVLKFLIFTMNFHPNEKVKNTLNHPLYSSKSRFILDMLEQRDSCYFELNYFKTHFSPTTISAGERKYRPHKI